MPRWASHCRAASQGAQSAPVYSVTGKRVVTARSSDGSAAFTGTGGAPSRRSCCTWPVAASAGGRSV